MRYFYCNKHHWKYYTILVLFTMMVSACGGTVIDDTLSVLDEEEIVAEDSMAFVPRPIIAHRGYHSGKTYPANSIAAFKRALLLNDIYGTEFDVRETADGILVICHDATHAGLSVEENTYATLSEHLLANGEPLPLLADMLDVYLQTETNVKLIIELKLCNVENVVKMVNDRHLGKQAEYISFNRSYCEKLASMGLGKVTSYLSGNMPPSDVAKAQIGGIDYNFSVFKNHPNWIDEAKALGLKTIVWTVNDKNMVKDFIDKGVIVTTDFPNIDYSAE